MYKKSVQIIHLRSQTLTISLRSALVEETLNLFGALSVLKWLMLVS